ncbi:Macrolide export protein MacA [bioreactor metagenome]|uniref:Macrolide export protein MacA n=1 Tax=bioreactor metagenome TaxID=1076179 RepID=A0A644T0H3_9ZZZZ|nr:efflux RND transporter periplasmic adaptor subunit [Negativicutes bacterium]
MASAKKKKTIFIVTAIIIVLASIISYRIYSNITTNKQRAAKMSQGQVVAVEVAAVSRTDINPILNFSANLEPVWIADISSKVDGRIDLLKVDEGDTVSEGMIIAVLDTNELSAQVVQAEGNLLSSQANLEQAELELRRTEALTQQGALSAQSLDNARTKRNLYAGQVRSAVGNLNLLQARLDNANIYAPRNGVVVKRYLQSGVYAKAGTAIVSVANVSSLLAKAIIGEAQISQLLVGTKVKVTVDALGGQEFEGVITRISPAAVLPARTFIAEITIPNSDGILKSGMFAKAAIPGQVRQGALAVPEKALVLREDQKSVYVVNADNKVQQRVIQVGFVGGGWAEVLDGLNEGEKIVVAGQNKLKDGSAIRAPSESKAGGI